MVLSALPAEGLRAVLAPLAAARGLPPAAYTHPAVFAWELSTLFAEGFFAASLDDVRGPGDWVRAPLGDDRLVVARDAAMELALLRDRCRHRGATLFDGDLGRRGDLCVRCPYHGWRYALSGDLDDAPGAAAGLDRRGYAIAAGAAAADGLAVRAATADGLAGAWGKVPWLAALAPHGLRRARAVAWEVHANWKLLVENFQESHHFGPVHPWLEARTPWRRSRSHLDGAGWLGGEMPLVDAETVSTTGARRGRPLVASPADAGTVRDAWVAPNLLTSVQPDYALVYRLHPLAPDRTRVACDTWVHAAAGDDHLDEVFALWDRVNAEDRGVCERQQDGLVGAREAGVYCESEDGVHAFDRWWSARALGGEGR
jgi:Rieske 2Fe-2S family protein